MFLLFRSDQLLEPRSFRGVEKEVLRQGLSAHATKPVAPTVNNRSAGRTAQAGLGRRDLADESRVACFLNPGIYFPEDVQSRSSHDFAFREENTAGVRKLVTKASRFSSLARNGCLPGRPRWFFCQQKSRSKSDHTIGTGTLSHPSSHSLSKSAVFRASVGQSVGQSRSELLVESVPFLVVLI